MRLETSTARSGQLRRCRAVTVVAMYGLIVGVLFQTPSANAIRRSIEQAQTGSLSGRVLDADTNAPLAGVRVGIAKQWTKTGTDGRYAFADLTPGSATVTLDSPFASTMFASPVTATVTAGGVTAVRDILVRLPGRLSGRVVDEHGSPLVEWRVLLVGREYSRRGWFPVGSELGQGLVYVRYAEASTDDRGVYAFANVAAARSHWVMAVPARRAAAALGQGHVPIAGEALPAPAVAYYPGGSSLEAATPIVLGSLEHREGVNIVVANSPSYCLGATIVKDGAPIAVDFAVQEVELARLRADGIDNGEPVTGRTGPDGKVRVCGLPSGQYQLSAAESLKTRDRPQHGATVPITIDRQHLDAGVVPLNPPVTITGRVTWPSEAQDGAAKRALYVSLWPPATTPFGSVKAVSDFSVQVSPLSHHSLSIDPPRGPDYVQSVTWNGERVDANGASFLAPPVSPGQLEIQIGTGCGSIDVLVQDPSGAVVPHAWVLIKPSSVTSEAALAAALMAGSTRESGTYRESCLEPRRYDVMAPRVPPPGVVQTGNTPVVDRTPEVMNELLKGSGGWQRVEVQSGVATKVTVVQR